MKILLIILALIISGCSHPIEPMGGVEDDDDQGIAKEQKEYLKANGKYKQIKKVKIGDLERHGDEYVRPDGSVGYQIYEREKRADGVYSRSYGVGGDSITKSFEWILTEPATTTVSTFKYPNILDFFVGEALAADVKSTSLVRTSNQYWYITDGSQTGLDFSTVLTLEAWINPTELIPVSGRTYPLIAKRDSNNMYVFELTRSGTTQYLALRVKGGGTDETLWVSHTESADWMHVAVTWDGSSSTAKLYINGTQQGSDQTGSVTSIGNITGDFGVGRELLSGDQYNGLVDEARAWSVIRTDTEIADNYDCELSSAQISDGNLEGYWKFEDDGTDESGNSNDLTNGNSATFSTDVPTLTGVCGAVEAGSPILMMIGL